MSVFSHHSQLRFKHWSLFRSITQIFCVQVKGHKFKFSFSQNQENPFNKQINCNCLMSNVLCKSEYVQTSCYSPGEPRKMGLYQATVSSPQSALFISVLVNNVGMGHPTRHLSLVEPEVSRL